MDSTQVQTSLISSNIHQFNLLIELINQLDDGCYASSLHFLEGGTIGKHIRHILDFYQCLIASASSGIICYDHRRREASIETIPDAALERIQQIILFLSDIQQDKDLLMMHDDLDADVPTMKTSLFREMAYAREHTIHHCAIIRLALNNVHPNIIIPPEFGKAPSTIRYELQNNLI